MHMESKVMSNRRRKAIGVHQDPTNFERAKPELRRCLSVLAGWLRRWHERRGIDFCNCIGRRQYCLIHRAEHVIKKDTLSVWTLHFVLRRLVRAAQDGKGPRRCDCQECLVCQSKAALRMVDQIYRGAGEEASLKPRKPKKVIRVVGGLCFHGHLLEGDNVCFRLDGSVECRACRRDSWKKRKKAPQKTKTGYCQSGLHPKTPENIRLDNDGHERCKLCCKEAYKTRTRMRNPILKKRDAGYCKTGKHFLTEKNTYITKRNWKICLDCKKEAVEARAKALRERFAVEGFSGLCRRGKHQRTEKTVYFDKGTEACRPCRVEANREKKRLKLALREQEVNQHADERTMVRTATEVA